MLNKVSERKIHIFRYVLVISWILMIISLFYDPISAPLTNPNNIYSPLRDQILLLAQDPSTCIRVQGECLNQQPYPIATRIFWGMTVPTAIAIVLVLGHETWRRICPLYFLSQIPRALGIKPKLKIEHNKFLVNNHLYLQFFLFYLGLNARILFINAARPVFGLFLILTILSAIIMVFLYGGRSWCHYVCPFGMVQMVFTGPRGLLDSEAHTAPPRTVTQSMCRTFDSKTGQEKITCISCKSPCMDIDSEKAYWHHLTKPGRKLVQYGYLGLVIGYFVYYYLYAGNFNYYFSGAWTHEKNQLASLFKPGFYIFEHAIPIPKIIATPLTLAAFVLIACGVCTQIEKAYTTYLRRNNPEINREQAIHRIFSVCTFLAFNIFYIYGGRPEILRLPQVVQLLFNSLVILISTVWLYRTWGRSLEKYKKETIADKLRRQLKKLNLNLTRILNNRSLNQLKPDELDILAQVLPQATRQDRLQVYKGVLEESLAAGNIQAANSLNTLAHLRQPLEISEEEHYAVLAELGLEDPTLFKSNQESAQEERLRIQSYREALAAMVQELVDSGMPLQDAIALKTKQIQNLKQEYRITKQEHLQVLSGMWDILRPKAEALLALLQQEALRYQAIIIISSHSPTPIFVLLRKLLLIKQQLIVTSLLTILEIFHNQPDAIELAKRIGIVTGDAVAELLKDQTAGWQHRLSPQILKELKPVRRWSESQTSLINEEATQIKISSVTSQEVSIASKEAIEEILLDLSQEPNPITQAASLYALTQLNPEKGQQQASQLLTKNMLGDLVKETVAYILDEPHQSPSIIEQLLTLSQQNNFQSLTSEKLLSLVTQANKQVKFI